MSRDQRPVTMLEVARKAGVSRALVSIVLRDVPGASEKTRAHVKQVAADLGYVPDARAQSLRGKSSPAIGVAFQPAQRFHAAIIDGIYHQAQQAGLRVVLSAVTETHGESEAAAALLANRCGAIITLGSRLPTDELLALADRVPVVVVAKPAFGPGIESVCSDDEAGLASAVDHLVELGHRRIWFCSSPGSGGNDERVAGYQNAMTTHGLSDQMSIIPAASDEEGGASAAAKILASPHPPTAVIGFNDPCAAGIQDVLTRAGIRIPQDISLMGYDDSEIAAVTYRQLTSVRQHITALAERATQRAIALLSGEDQSTAGHTLGTTLTIRATTAPPPDDA